MLQLTVQLKCNYNETIFTQKAFNGDQIIFLYIFLWHCSLLHISTIKIYFQTMLLMPLHLSQGFAQPCSHFRCLKLISFLWKLLWIVCLTKFELRIPLNNSLAFSLPFFLSHSSVLHSIFDFQLQSIFSQISHKNIIPYYVKWNRTYLLS